MPYSMVLRVFPGNINEKHLERTVEVLKSDGPIIIPTDTVYALACSLKSRPAFERICEMKHIKPSQANFSVVFSDFRHLSEYTKPFSKEVFRMMKSNLPGPFTFILNANNQVPELFRSRKKTIGIRIPDHEFVLKLVTRLGNPLIVSSLHNEDSVTGYYNDVAAIDDKYRSKTDLIIDGGYSEMVPSTVIDCTTQKPVLIRKGKGEIVGE